MLVIALADEADLATLPPHIARARIEWGQVGALMKLLSDFQTQHLVMVGGIARRPELSDLRLDWGALSALPHAISVLAGGGDQSVLDKLAAFFSRQNLTLVGVHEIAPSLLAQAGQLAGPPPSKANEPDMAQAAQAAWRAGQLDMGQGAVVVSRRPVAMEGAEGTDGMLERVAAMRTAQRFSARGKTGVLAKCPRPGQDRRMDMPTIGPRTIEMAALAGLCAILLEADAVLVCERARTLELAASRGIGVIARPRGFFVPEGSVDQR